MRSKLEVPRAIISLRFAFWLGSPSLENSVPYIASHIIISDVYQPLEFTADKIMKRRIQVSLKISLLFSGKITVIARLFCLFVCLFAFCSIIQTTPALFN